MGTPGMAVQSIIGMVICLANIPYWWWMMTRGQDRFRRRCEAKYGVTIGQVGKGFWQVQGSTKPWLRRMAIEWLQLAFIMGVFVGWAVALIGLIAVMKLFD